MCLYFGDVAGTSSRGVKFRGNVEVSNLSDENDVDDLDVSLPAPGHSKLYRRVY